MMKTTTVSITLLADNSALPPFREEHGFSALVRVTEAGSPASGNGTLLFDTGQGVLFDNAREAGIDLKNAEYVVLSHGHYDHTNALPRLLRENPDISVSASDKIFSPHFSLSAGKSRSISLSGESRSALAALSAHKVITFSQRLTLFDGRVNLSGRISRLYSGEQTSPHLFQDSDCTIPDSVDDEIALWVNTKRGLVILTGCCHAG